MIALVLEVEVEDEDECRTWCEGGVVGGGFISPHPAVLVGRLPVAVAPAAAPAPVLVMPPRGESVDTELPEDESEPPEMVRGTSGRL